MELPQLKNAAVMAEAVTLPPWGLRARQCGDSLIPCAGHSDKFMPHESSLAVTKSLGLPQAPQSQPTGARELWTQQGLGRRWT